MANLTPIDKRLFRDLFGLDGGYVLDFVNSTFAELFRDMLGIDIYHDKYAQYGDSKAKRLFAFWEMESDAKVGQILNELLRVAEIKGLEQANSKYIMAKKVIERLTKNKISEDKFILPDMWEKDKLRVFISHRDRVKTEAKKLSDYLEQLGVTSFIAHDSIVPMRIWKHEIYKALETMEAFICFITEDFYESFWTNQEIGFALAKRVPIFLYSHDKTDPEGFNEDFQAIKTGEAALFQCIKKKFSSCPSLKKGLLEELILAKDGTWDNAKEKFCQILGFSFLDPEIETIVDAINGPAKTSYNQLKCLLYDPVSEEVSKIWEIKKDVLYRDLLNEQVLKQHSKGRYKIKSTGNEVHEQYEIIDIMDF
ncbi:MAG: toll/interleukin-1 receptor domain-containing protein [Nanoarchaeota archaeon]|nr:toll/interleukin-1 receptor domain-containing protein [Nanoarchaeota archaeon]